MSTIFGYIDSLARIIGYGAMLFGALHFFNRCMEDRAALRAHLADRDYLNDMSKRDPEGYEKEMWWRSNMRRKEAGLPTDPGFEEKGQRMVQSLRENGLL